MNWELAPREADADDDRPPSSAFAWPTPPYAAYPASEEQRVPLACEIQGINGKLMRGPDDLLRALRAGGARAGAAGAHHAAAALRPVPQPAPDRSAGARGAPPAKGDGGKAAKAYELLAQRPHSPFQLTWADGEEAQGETIGHVLEEFGLFLFNPLDAADRVQREFIPRSAFRSFEIGSSIGELLIDSQAATQQQVERAEHEHSRRRNRKLGDILLTQHVLTPAALTPRSSSSRACRWCASARR